MYGREELTDLFNEDKTEEQEPEEQGDSGGKIYLVFLAILIPVFFFFEHIGGADMGLTAFLCLGAVMVAAGICWDLRDRWWFWAVIAIVVAIHAPLVLFVRWPHRWIPGLALAPIGFADCIIVVKFVRFVQKYIVKYTPPSDEDNA
jgi:hypothetical protein